MNWTEKYRPRNLKDVIGNKKAKERISRWAKKWQEGKPDKKAVILYGRPGVGKTTSAYALANDFGWEVIELNASDERNKEIIRRIALSGAVNETIGYDGEFVAGRKKLIILDEADNLYEKKGDYGGKRAIIDTIKKSKQPIVLIANNYHNLTKGAGQELRHICHQIEFKPVDEGEIVSLLKKICRSEGIVADDKVLYAIARRSNGDVRSAINDLQSISYVKKIDKEVVENLGYRNREKEIFNGLREIFRARDIKTAVRTAYSLDESPDDLIIWIDENLPREYIYPEDLKNAYEFLSRADIMLGRTRRRQYYGLWSYATELMTGCVAVAKKHNYFTSTKYSFPTWLKSMSASKKSRAMKDRIAGKIGKVLHCSKRKAMDMIPYIKVIGENSDIASIFDFTREEVEFLTEKVIENSRIKRGQKTLF